MKKTFIHTMAMAIVILIFFPGSSSAGPYTVTHVYDGGMLKMKVANTVSMIRLVGIEAMKNGIDELKTYLELMLLNKEVQVKKYGSAHRGYILGEVFLNGKNINRELIKSGMASVDRKTFLNGLDIKSFSQSEHLAKTERKGFWGTDKLNKNFAKWIKNKGTRLAFFMLLCEQ
jgi:endonuclease YncB( thermonuclease family)